MATWYVNTDNAGTEDGTTVETGYKHLQTAIAAKAGVLSEPCIFNCRGATADTTYVHVTGYTTSAANYISIVVDQANRHDGKWNPDKFRLSLAGVYADAQVRISANYCYLDGLQIEGSDSGAAYAVVYVASENVRISNCVIRKGASSHCLNLVDAANISCTIWNSILYGSSGPALWSRYGLTCYSSTLIGGTYGLLHASSSATAKNVYAKGSTAAFGIEGGSLTQTNCAASDTSADGTDPHDSVAYDTDTFVNVTAGSEDLHLAADGLSPLQGHGVDTSGESAPLNFTTDIDGHARDATWDIGADAWVVAASSFVPRIMIL